MAVIRGQARWKAADDIEEELIKIEDATPMW
jgi:hypothetical protein